ncbi:hypothetical protein [Actinoplanes sp. NPDC049802]|uniref:hypothetical protein n=1 Tax=Actinoplanes sp. NPDC049802 TaxID=3154742 RepID=UPI0033D052D8
MVLVGVAGLLLSGCFTTGVPDRLEYVFGVARIGDTYQVFAPLCPGEKTVGIKVDDFTAADEDLDEQYGDDPYTWWRVAGPKAAAGPGEMIALGGRRTVH